MNRMAPDPCAPPPAPEPEYTLADASHNVQAELDLALGLMQKRLGCKVMVGKDEATKPGDDPDVTGLETEEEKEAREKKEAREASDKEFERRMDEAEARATTRLDLFGGDDDLGSDCAYEPHPATLCPELADAERRGADYRLATDEAIDRFLEEPAARLTYDDMLEEPCAVGPRERYVEVYDDGCDCDGCDCGHDDAPPLRTSRAFVSAGHGAAAVSAVADARARASHHHFSASASLHNVRSSRVDRLSRTAPGELGDFAYVPDEPFAYAPDEPGRPRGARDRLGDGRARLRGLEDSGALDATLDNRERLARVKTLRKAVRGEALDKGGV